MPPGQVIVLNGTSSAGKSTLAAAIQARAEVPYLRTGVDDFLGRLPERFVREPVDGWSVAVRDGRLAELPTIGPRGLELFNAHYRAVAAYAAAGGHVIVDDVLYDRRVLDLAVAALHRLPVLFVGIRCPAEVAEARELARGDRLPGGARLFEAAHAHAAYDLELDTAALTPEECADAILAALPPPDDHAFARLHPRLAPT
jgi:chloramphenicol 3-O phosphotransferase